MKSLKKLVQKEAAEPLLSETHTSIRLDYPSDSRSKAAEPPESNMSMDFWINPETDSRIIIFHPEWPGKNETSGLDKYHMRA